MTGVYDQIAQTTFSTGGLLSMSLFGGLSADEYTLFNGTSNTTYVSYYENALTNISPGVTDFWSNIYPLVYDANAAIEGLTPATALTPAVRQQLLGEAKFVRAFCYFYLVNLYGEVPLVLSTNYATNALLPKSSTDSVWQQVISDLKDAETLLGSNYLDGTLLVTSAQRVRPTKWAAAALLARAYLFTKDWSDAAQQASSVINNTSLYSLNALDSVFLANSNEAIWQLQPVIAGFNTQEAMLFIIPSTGLSDSYPVCLSSFLLNDFEPGDNRRSIWVDSVASPDGTSYYYYPFKYEVNTPNAPVTEYEMVLRLGEQLLIRAEANAEQNDILDAVADLNKIRERANLPDTTFNDQADLLKAIYHERRIEFFSEWGTRWLDMKRTASVDTIMSTVTPTKGGNWGTTDQLYPILLTELKSDPNLSQNPGY
jgi:hypothetical protein